MNEKKKYNDKLIDNLYGDLITGELNTIGT
jgi:hypothetical protein